MTVTAIKIMFVLGILGHALNMYCVRILSIFPNGTIKFDNIAEIKKDGVLAKMMEGVSPEVPLRSAVLGVFALVLEFLSYVSLGIYTYEKSQVFGAIMFVTAAFFCIVGSGFHVKTALAEYVFLKLDGDSRAKDIMLDLKDNALILRICMAGMVVYIITLIAAIVTGVIGFPVWSVIFTILPVAILLFPLKIIGTLHIAAMVSMFAWIFLI